MAGRAFAPLTQTRTTSQPSTVGPRVQPHAGLGNAWIRDALGQGQDSTLDLALRPGWDSDAPTLRRWEAERPAPSLLATARSALMQAAAAGAAGPLMEQGLTGKSVDRGPQYLKDNIANSSLDLRRAGVRDLAIHPAAGAWFGYVPTYQAMRDAGADRDQAMMAGAAAATVVGIAIEAMQMTEGDPTTGRGTHPGSFGDAVISTGLGGAVVGMALQKLHEEAGALARETGNPLFSAVHALTRTENVVVAPLIQDGKVKGATIQFRTRF